MQHGVGSAKQVFALRHLFVVHKLLGNAFKVRGGATRGATKDKMIKPHHQEGCVLPILYRAGFAVYGDEAFAATYRSDFEVVVGSYPQVLDFDGRCDVEARQHEDICWSYRHTHLYNTRGRYISGGLCCRSAYFSL